MTKGANVGAQADLGLGPLKLSTNAGFETIRSKDDLVGDYWYEPLAEGSEYDELSVEPPVEFIQTPDGASKYFGLQVSGLMNIVLLQQLSWFQGGVAVGPLQLNAGIGAGR